MKFKRYDGSWSHSKVDLRIELSGTDELAIERILKILENCTQDLVASKQLAVQEVTDSKSIGSLNKVIIRHTRGFVI